MGTVVTVMSGKGGVGKTTVAMHLAGIYARYKLEQGQKKVLLIDYDPQFNLSQAFIASKKYFSLENARKTVIAILSEDDINVNPYHLQVPGNENPPPVSDIVHNIYGYKNGARLDIIPSTLDLMYVALSQSKSYKAIEERFRKFIAECRDVYDLVFIDCHPAGSLLTKTSLGNSDNVIIPVVPQRYAVRGIALMMKFIGAVKTGTPTPTPHILFNHTSRNADSAVKVDILLDPKIGHLCLGATLKYYKAFSDPVEGKGFVWTSGRPYSTRAFRNLVAVARELEPLITQEGTP